MTRPHRFLATFLCVLLIAVLAGCSGSGRSARSSGGGGYYKDDGPGSNIPANIAAIPDAVPRIEAHRPANARPYVVFGKRYVPISEQAEFRQQGTASWYGRKFHGNKTASGETYDMYAMTAAHPTLPLPSYARVTRATTGKSVIVRINDRGPFHSSRIIDLSYVAAAKLDLIGPGSGQVIVEAITTTDIRNNTWNRNGSTPKAQPIAPAAPPPPAQTAPVLVTQAPAPNSLTAPQVFLQFGAFGAPQSAGALVSQINQGIQYIETRQAHVAPGANLYRVQLGPYPSRTDAVNAALRIEQQTGLPAAVTFR